MIFVAFWIAVCGLIVAAAAWGLARHWGELSIWKWAISILAAAFAIWIMIGAIRVELARGDNRIPGPRPSSEAPQHNVTPKQATTCAKIEPGAPWCDF